jgi:hypothetical protein
MMRRAIWVGGIGLANAGAAGLVSTWLVRDAAGDGWGVLVPCASLATLGLSVGGLWWVTSRRRRRGGLRTGLATGLVIGVLVHPVTWYLALVSARVSGARSSLGEPSLTPLEGLSAVWVYAGVSLLFTGWLSGPISAAICGAGLALYARWPRE